MYMSSAIGRSLSTLHFLDKHNHLTNEDVKDHHLDLFTDVVSTILSNDLQLTQPRLKELIVALQQVLDAKLGKSSQLLPLRDWLADKPRRVVTNPRKKKKPSKRARVADDSRAGRDAEVDEDQSDPDEALNPSIIDRLWSMME